MLKHSFRGGSLLKGQPAAFRRLCVETGLINPSQYRRCRPAAFRRLCVETIIAPLGKMMWAPAAFRRLCVETSNRYLSSEKKLPAAFRRLCVETSGVSDGH